MAKKGQVSPAAGCLGFGCLGVVLLVVGWCTVETFRPHDPPEKQLSDRDVQSRREFVEFYNRVYDMDCPSEEQDNSAIEVVTQVHSGQRGLLGSSRDKSGSPSAPRLRRLTTRSNPRGEGVIVTALEDSERGADYHRKRSVWLVLDGRLYPLNLPAAQNFGSIFDGLPDSIQERAGIVHSYEQGKTTLNQLGLEESSRRRYHGSVEGSFFPDCKGGKLKLK